MSGHIKSYGQHYLDNNDFLEIQKVLKSDFITQGPTIKKFENKISQKVGSKEALVCSSGTSALHLALISINIKEGDYVIIPAITFLAAANSVKYLNAKIIFTDVNHESGLVEPENLEKTIQECKKLNILGKVKAFIPVHLNGQCVDLKPINYICKKNNIKIIEDSCHALGSKYKPLNSNKKYKIGDCSFSDISTFSFHPVKNITTGEGGALTFNKKEIKKKLKVFRNHGIIKSKKFFNYEVKELGFNYRLSDINCALGLSQLKKINYFIRKRKNLFDYYNKKISNLSLYLKPIKTYKYCEPAWHLYVVRIDFKKIKVNKNKFAKELLKKGIGSQVHYVPLIFQPLYKKELRISNYKGAKEYYKNCLTLPLSVNMRYRDIDYIVFHIKKIIMKKK